MDYSRLINQMQVWLSQGLQGSRQYRFDLLSGCILAVLVGGWSFFGSQLIPADIFDGTVSDIWFDSDMGQYVGAMLYRDANHTRSDKHPLFSLLSYPPTFLLEKILGNPLLAVKTYVAAIAALWIIGFFAVLRSTGCRRFDAVVFSALAAVSAAGVFWLPVPETFALGSFSILVAIGFAVLSQHYKVPWGAYVLVSAATFSVTATNWMAGIAVTMVNFRWRRALPITISAFCLVMLVWALQKLIFPSAQLPLLVTAKEGQFFFSSRAGGWLQVLKGFISDGMVMPAIRAIPYPAISYPVLSVQASLPAAGSIWGMAALPIWLVLLGWGVKGIATLTQLPKLRLVLILTLAGQLILHLAYGYETFLYSLHFTPLLVILAAMGTFTRQRQLILALTMVLVILVGMNNGLMFAQALATATAIAPISN